MRSDSLSYHVRYVWLSVKTNCTASLCVFYLNCILGLLSSNTLLFVIRVNSNRCLLYWQTFLFYRSDDKVNEVSPLRTQPCMTSIASNFGTFARLQKRGATASAFMSVSGSVCKRGVSSSYQRGFREIWYLEFLLKSVDTFRYSLKSNKSERHIKGRPTYFVVTGVYYGDSVYCDVRRKA